MKGKNRKCYLKMRKLFCTPYIRNIYRVANREFQNRKPKILIQLNTYIRHWSLENIEDTLRELGRNKFLNNYYADQTIYHCELSDHAIVTMENQKKGNIAKHRRFYF